MLIHQARFLAVPGCGSLLSRPQVSGCPTRPSLTQPRRLTSSICICGTQRNCPRCTWIFGAEYGRASCCTPRRQVRCISAAVAPLALCAPWLDHLRKVQPRPSRNQPELMSLSGSAQAGSWCMQVSLEALACQHGPAALPLTMIDDLKVHLACRSMAQCLFKQLGADSMPAHTACPAAGGPGEVLMVQQPEGHCRDPAPAAGAGAAAAPACLHLQVRPLPAAASTA